MPGAAFYETFGDASCEAWQAAVRFGISEGEKADNPIGFAAMAMLVTGMRLMVQHPEWAQAAMQFFTEQSHHNLNPLADTITTMCPVRWQDEMEAI